MLLTPLLKIKVPKDVFRLYRMKSVDDKFFFNAMLKGSTSTKKMAYQDDQIVASFARRVFQAVYDLGICTKSNPHDWSDAEAVAFFRNIFWKMKQYF